MRGQSNGVCTIGEFPVRFFYKFYYILFRYFESRFGDGETFVEKIGRMAFLFCIVESILFYAVADLTVGNFAKFVNGKFWFVLPTLIILIINYIFFYFRHDSIIKKFE